MTMLRVAPILAFLLMPVFPAAAATPDPGCTLAPVTLTHLFPGIESATTTLDCPGGGSSTVHVVRVDLVQPGLSFVTSGPGKDGAGSFNLELTTDFLLRTNSQVAINANLFTNCCTDVSTPETTQLHGLEISGRKTLSPIQHNPRDKNAKPPNPPPYPFAASLLATGKTLRIATFKKLQTIVPQADAAVTGSHMLVSGGSNVAPLDKTPADFFGPYARTLVGLSAGNGILWIAAVDRSTSNGITLPQAAQLMQKLGAANALNLDGGGSTSLAVDAGPGQVRLLNTPTDPDTSGCFSFNGHCERYVGAILGIKVSPLPAP